MRPRVEHKEMSERTGEKKSRVLVQDTSVWSL